MGQAQSVLDLARSQVGYREGSNNYTKYAPAVPGLEWAQNQPWCQTFQSWLFRQTGLANLAPVTASCASATQWYKDRNRFSEYPAVGAMIFFGSGGGSHVGIVYKYDSTYVYTIEGNTNDNGSAEGNGVYYKQRTRRDPYVYGYGYPAYSEGIVSADPKWGGVASADKPKAGVALNADAPFVSFLQVEWAAKASIQDERRVAEGPNNPQDDVTKVQVALKATVGLGSDVQTGFFDAPTVGAYMAWQKKLGYSGQDADGIPGLDSLTKLGETTGKFRVNDTSGAYRPVFVEVKSENPVEESSPVKGDSVVKEATTVQAARPWVWASVGQGESRNTPNSVRVVQDALKSEFPIAEWAEEYGIYWGPRTKQGYRWWQEKLGYTGSDADGVPGKSSLVKLGDKQGFDVNGEVPETPSSASPSGQIGTSQIDFTGKGTWNSGSAACTGYIKEALKIMGLPETHWLNGMLTIAARETAYNSPQWQINTTDSNARNTPELFGGGNAPDGYKSMCSRGMIQAIPQTFARYHVAGTSAKIYDPVASAAAGINYIINVYNVNRDGSNLTSKVQQADPNRAPRGY